MSIDDDLREVERYLGTGDPEIENRFLHVLTRLDAYGATHIKGCIDHHLKQVDYLKGIIIKLVKHQATLLNPFPTREFYPGDGFGEQRINEELIDEEQAFVIVEYDFRYRKAIVGETNKSIYLRPKGLFRNHFFKFQDRWIGSGLEISLDYNQYFEYYPYLIQAMELGHPIQLDSKGKPITKQAENGSGA